MATYPTMGNATGLGGLLRKMQEERLNAAYQVPQSAQDSSPIRAQVQGPLSMPESVGSDKVVSIKPEMASPGAGGVVAPVGANITPSPMMGGRVVGPTAAIPQGVPGISDPNPAFSPAGIQTPNNNGGGSNNNNGGQVAGASTNRAAVAPVQAKAPVSAQPMYKPSPFNNNSSNNNSSQPAKQSNTSLSGLASELLPSAMKSMNSVKSAMSTFRGALSGVPLITKSQINKFLYGIPFGTKQQSS